MQENSVPLFFLTAEPVFGAVYEPFDIGAVEEDDEAAEQQCRQRKRQQHEERDRVADGRGGALFVAAAGGLRDADRPPIARPTSMTVSMCITCEPMETAVVLATPSNWPMMKRSAMP